MHHDLWYWKGFCENKRMCWHQNKDNVGGATCWSSYSLYNRWNCTLIFNIEKTSKPWSFVLINNNPVNRKKIILDPHWLHYPGLHWRLIWIHLDLDLHIFHLQRGNKLFKHLGCLVFKYRNLKLLLFPCKQSQKGDRKFNWNKTFCMCVL